MSELRVGTSGWQYKHWKGRFYPKELPTAKWLDHYTRFFDTVELNNPFYRQPEKKTFEKWRRSVPDDFVYAVKLKRFITHPSSRQWAGPAGNHLYIIALEGHASPMS